MKTKTSNEIISSNKNGFRDKRITMTSNEIRSCDWLGVFPFLFRSAMDYIERLQIKCKKIAQKMPDSVIDISQENLLPNSYTGQHNYVETD